ncbi:hypothetical protein MNKW57_12880 [Biformimicrobium ophioploci]|uniref:NuBaID C-terminal domain-containing protein n=1 Tax=Biformimicrobium ophioploci TaxID=3036711 RepID=A0ABQ6LY70_9GAMM|nr:hypothetical protein MNKW57_12880 [Microbulbifer sp. NKW57]
MLYRCNSTNSNSYRWYGAKGIRVCERWQDFWNFAEDMGEKPSSVHTLDRIDNAGDYCPENCRWATPKEQANNRTSNRLCQVFDETRSFKEWADLAGMSHQRLRHRVDNLGIGLEAALCGG